LKKEIDNQIESKEKLEEEIVSLRKKLKKLEAEYYEKYLKGNGDCD
jgi:hypothetical protein